MRKESRANVIFFLVVLVLIAPGFVILMRKKLAGPTDPAHLPTMIPHQAAYIQPDPIPPRAPRVEPPEVRAWVTRQLHDRFDPNASVLRDDTGAGAVVSDAYATQLVHVDDQRLILLVWSADVERVSLGTQGEEADIATVEPAWIDVTRDIRHTLQRVGYTDPPERIAWVDVPLDRPLARGSDLRVSYGRRAERIRVP
jgi:hypothetical protein